MIWISKEYAYANYTYIKGKKIFCPAFSKTVP